MRRILSKVSLICSVFSGSNPTLTLSHNRLPGFLLFCQFCVCCGPRVYPRKASSKERMVPLPLCGFVLCVKRDSWWWDLYAEHKPYSPPPRRVLKFLAPCSADVVYTRAALAILSPFAQIQIFWSSGHKKNYQRLGNYWCHLAGPQVFLLALGIL